MSAEPHVHGVGCDCAGHRPRDGLFANLAALAPIGACAVCPACLATYAKVLALLGVGFALAEWQHTVVLAATMCLACGFALVRARRTRSYEQLSLTLLAAAMMIAGHLIEVAIMEWLGCALLLVATIVRMRGRRGVRYQHVAPAAVGHSVRRLHHVVR